MTKVIWEYPIDIRDSFKFFMPKGAEILSAQAQNNVPCIWALVSSTTPLVQRKFRVLGTGFPIPEDSLSNMKFVGTIQQNGGTLVWHLFDLGEE